MGHLVCRAITLYRYHIPITNISLEPQYSTIGFFDGMSTETLDVRYEEEDLKALWQYTTKRTRECDGSYSFQNMYGFRILVGTDRYKVPIDHGGLFAA